MSQINSPKNTLFLLDALSPIILKPLMGKVTLLLLESCDSHVCYLDKVSPNTNLIASVGSKPNPQRPHFPQGCEDLFLMTWSWRTGELFVQALTSQSALMVQGGPIPWYTEGLMGQTMLWLISKQKSYSITAASSIWKGALFFGNNTYIFWTFFMALKLEYVHHYKKQYIICIKQYIHLYSFSTSLHQ